MPAFLSPRQLRYLAMVVLTATVVIWGGVFWQFSQLRQSSATSSAVPASAPVNSAPVNAAPAISSTTPTGSPVASAPQPSGGIPFPRPEFSAAPAPGGGVPTPSPQPGLPPVPIAATTNPASSLPVNPVPRAQTRYNHFPYREAPAERLVQIGTYYERSESLDREAAAAFQQLVAAAQAEGVKIILISGFRTIADQEQLFERQIQRTGGVTAAARLSAPPGYSEHHTGYALDLGDGNVPGADLKYTFEETPAFRWLQRHARQYGFELSFPDGNSQGVSFEPWHWRYIGSSRAQAIFAAARGNLAGPVK